MTAAEAPGPAVGTRIRRAVYARGTWDDGNTALLMFLLAFGLLVHKTLLPEPFTAPWPVLSPVLAALVLWLPRSRPLGVILAGLVAVEIVWFWPHVVNHAVFVAFMAAAVVVLPWTASVRNGEAAVQDALFPVLRAGLYVLFAFAVLHKLNQGFLDPVGSCAVDHYAQLRARLGFLPEAVSPAARIGLIAATLASEVAIPLLLWGRRTRLAGLALAFGFHLVMGVNGHHTFSAFAPAMYVPFLPASAHRWLATESGAAGARWGRASTALLAGLGTVVAVLLLVGGASGRPYLALELGWVGFYLLAVVVAGAGALTCHRWRGATAPPRGPTSRLAATALLGALVVNGLSPYFGLKTEIAFSMFSNLRTESDGWNHLFVPAGVRWSTLQDTVIFVDEITGSEGELARLSRRGDGFVPPMARALLTEACREGAGPIAIRFRIGDRSGASDDACAARPFGPPDPWWRTKLFSYRPVPAANVCRH